MQSTPSLSFATREMMRARGLREITLVVDGTVEVSPHMRRVEFTSADVASIAPKPGQDLLLMLPNQSNELERRHYTIRTFDAAARRLTIDFVLHGSESLAMRWLQNVRKDEQIIAFGPRGKNVLHEGAAWRLFVGDETGLPAIAGMIEALPDGAIAKAFIEIPEDADRQQITSRAAADIEWLPRNGPAQSSSPRLIEKLKSWTPPDGDGHIYLLAETGAVRAIRHDLLARGIAKSAIFAEGYWRPGRFGGHDHV